MWDKDRPLILRMVKEAHQLLISAIAYEIVVVLDISGFTRSSFSPFYRDCSNKYNAIFDYQQTSPVIPLVKQVALEWKDALELTERSTANLTNNRQVRNVSRPVCDHEVVNCWSMNLIVSVDDIPVLEYWNVVWTFSFVNSSPIKWFTFGRQSSLSACRAWIGWKEYHWKNGRWRMVWMTRNM